MLYGFLAWNPQGCNQPPIAKALQPKIIISTKKKSKGYLTIIINISKHGSNVTKRDDVVSGNIDRCKPANVDYRTKHSVHDPKQRIYPIWQILLHDHEKKDKYQMESHSTISVSFLHCFYWQISYHFWTWVDSLILKQ